MNTRPFPYQLEGALQIERFGGRALLSDEMGLGKSLEVLLWAKWNPDVRPIVVVCPAALKLNWQREASMHFGWMAEVLETTHPPPAGLMTGGNLFIVNYDILGQRAGDKTGEGWLEFLKGLKPKLVIIDECHFVSSSKAKRTRWVKQLCKGVKHVVALSGTPLTNKPDELWNTINLLRPDVFNNRRVFRERHTQPKLYRWGWTFNGAARLSELHNRLRRTMMIRRLKKDVLTDLPPKQRFVVPLEMDNKLEYHTAAKNLIAWLAKQSYAKANKAKRAERLVRVGHLKRLAARLKMGAVMEWVDDFLQESDGKLVLFAIHKPVVAALMERYSRIAVKVDGSVTGKDRQKAVDAFQHNSKVRLFIGNIKAAGVGINLTAAETVAFVEMGWTPGEMTQCEDRIHRVGQKGSAACFYLVAQGSIEEHLCALIQRKQKTLDSVLDGNHRKVTLNLFDQLVASLTKPEQTNGRIRR